MEHVKVVRGYWHDCTQWQDAPQIRLIEYVWALLCIFNRFPFLHNKRCASHVFRRRRRKRKRRRRSVESWDFQGTATCELQSQVVQYISLKLPYTIIISNYFHIVIWHQYILWISTSQFRHSNEGLKWLSRWPALWFQIFFNMMLSFWKWRSQIFGTRTSVISAEVTVVLRPRIKLRWFLIGRPRLHTWDAQGKCQGHLHPEMCPGMLAGLGCPWGSVHEHVFRDLLVVSFQVSLILINNSCFVCVYIYKSTDWLLHVGGITDNYFGIFLKHGVDRDV